MGRGVMGMKIDVDRENSKKKEEGEGDPGTPDGFFYD
jgi:hypothetical protein